MRVVQAPLAEVGKHVTDEIDVFICSASYEGRCLSIADRLEPSRVRIAIIAQNENHKDLHGTNPRHLLDRFGNRGKLVSLTTADSLRTADNLDQALQTCASDRALNVLVDITTFTHESLLILFLLLRTNFPLWKVRLIYSSASEYSVGESTESKWLSRGIANVRSVLGYPGLMLPSRKLHLIVLVGFEHERAAEVISAYEPSIISLGYGESDDRAITAHKSARQHFFQKVRAVFGAAQTFKFPCYDPAGTRTAIRQQINLHRDANTVIAPMNTKLSTIGAALVALEDDKAQVCYSQAVLYNVHNYSSPGDQFFLCDGLGTFS